MNQTKTSTIALACATALLWFNPAAADESAAKSTPDTQTDDLWSRETLFGDMGGLRPALDRAGVTLGLSETSEYLGVVSGGLRRGGAYLGLTQLTLSVDTEKALGWPGGTLFASGLQIHGRRTSLTEGNVGGLQTLSSIEAKPDTRLWELWYEQTFADERMSLRLGQQAVDQEFMTSDYGDTFVNAMFGWPALPSNDLPDGGPAYPLASLGARISFQPSDSVTLLAAVFDGYPAGHGTGDPQQENLHGLKFRAHDSALMIAELQYHTNLAGTSSSNEGLPGTYKIGGWYHAGRFDDQRYDATGLSLANPDSDGVARSHRGNYSIYAMADQLVWRASPESARSVGIFARAMGAPGDRNVVDFSADAGFVLKAPFAGRDNDAFGLGAGYARVSDRARGFDQDAASYGDTPWAAVRNGETFIEATYKYQVAPWWLLQADAQYVVHPGGGAADTENGDRRIRNALVLGLRTGITF